MESSIASPPDAVKSDEEKACRERLQRLLAFIEQTRAAQTTTSGEIGEQLERIERQLLDLEQLLQDRIQKEQTINEAPETEAFPPSGVPPDHLAISNRFRRPVAISLSPPPSITRDEITFTSAELQASISNTPTPKSQTSALATDLASEKPPSGGNTSSSLHLSRFPDVPNLDHQSARQRTVRSSRTSEDVSNAALRAQIESLGETIHTMVVRQRAFNEALEGLQRTGDALEPTRVPTISHGSDPPEDLSSRLANLLTDLEGFVRRQDSEQRHRKDDGFQEFLDLASARTSPSSVGHAEIIQARPVHVNATSISYARKMQGPRPRSESQSNVVTTKPTLSRTPSSASVRPRAKSLDSVQIVADEIVRTNPVISSEQDNVGSFWLDFYTIAHHDIARFVVGSVTYTSRGCTDHSNLVSQTEKENTACSLGYTLRVWRTGAYCTFRCSDQCRPGRGGTGYQLVKGTLYRASDQTTDDSTEKPNSARGCECSAGRYCALLGRTQWLAF